MTDPEVIYKDPHFLVINKPAGLQVHPARVKNASRAEPSTLTEWLVKHYPEVKKVGDDPETRPGIVHRLDKETSGIMLVARDQEYFEYLKSLFQKHEIKKTYLALVHGHPKKEEGVIDAPIGIKNGTLKRSIHSKKMAKEAVTEYRVVKTFAKENTALLEVKPRTGRTHQIRVHLASIGHPIVGDTLYCPKEKTREHERLMLHAVSLEFINDGGKRVKFETEAPF
jgi:23S rRNA pseudouridine1911/1915/1917 synthase